MLSFDQFFVHYRWSIARERDLTIIIFLPFFFFTLLDLIWFRYYLFFIALAFIALYPLWNLTFKEGKYD